MVTKLFCTVVPAPPAGQDGGALRSRPAALPSSPAGLQAVRRINSAIRRGLAADTVAELGCPAAQLPAVYPCAAAVYQQELALLQQQQGVRPGTAPAVTRAPPGRSSSVLAEMGGQEPTRLAPEHDVIASPLGRSGFAHPPPGSPVGTVVSFPCQ